MATSIERTWRRLAVLGVCSVISGLIAYARLHRGMHLLKDVVVDAINGLVCAGPAADYPVLRRGQSTETIKCLARRLSFPQFSTLFRVAVNGEYTHIPT